MPVPGVIQIADLCEKEDAPKQEVFLHKVMIEENAQRELSRRNCLMSHAGFLTYKSFEGYVYESVKFPPAFVRQALEDCVFIPEKRNLVLYEPVGVGKTHMAIATGVNACQKGYTRKFYTVTELILKLSEVCKDWRLERFITELKKLDLLILDECGYVPIVRAGSQLLFRVIADSYECKSLIHHGHLFLFEGQSYRIHRALMCQKT